MRETSLFAAAQMRPKAVLAVAMLAGLATGAAFFGGRKLGKAAETPPPPEPKALDVGALNARIHDGKIQLADTVTFNLFGITASLIVQARGDFEKSGSTFSFEPDTFTVGGCPLQRFPIIRTWVMKKLLFPNPPPPDVAAAWTKLTGVSVEGSSLKLRMP